MSNVLLRNRSVSELEFWKNGSDVRAAVTQFLMRESNIPKRWRPVFTFPGIDLARRLMEEITAAITIYPTTEQEAERRRAHQTEAVIICEQIIQHLQWLADTLPVKVSSLEGIAEAVRQRRKLKKFKRFLDAGQMAMPTSAPAICHGAVLLCTKMPGARSTAWMYCTINFSARGRL